MRGKLPVFFSNHIWSSLLHSQPMPRSSPTVDRRGNLYPTKQRPEQKIDAAVALMMAVGRAMAADDGQPDILAFLRNPVGT
jgi:hypothetical protein